MPTLYRASFGYLLRHPWQLGLALVGICIGVAVIVAVDLANNSSRKAFLLSMDTLNGAATHQVVGGPAGVDESVYVDLRRAGFRRAAPMVDGRVDAGALSLTVLGIDPLAEGEIRAYTLAGRDERGVLTGDAGRPGGFDETALRRLLVDPGASLLSGSAARALGLTVGDAYLVRVGGREERAIVAGIIADDVAALGYLVVVDVSTAQGWFRRYGYLSRIDLRLGGDEADELRRQLPDGVSLLEADARTRTTSEMSAAFMTNLTAMSLLALLVGIFLIYNSIGFAVLQRRGLVGVLRALGITRREVFGLIVFEAAGLGILGAVLGVAAGVWLGQALLELVSRSINDLYFRVSVTDLDLDPLSLAKGVAAGILATTLAAAGPAWEASGYRPRLAMQRSVLEQRGGRLVPWLAGAGLVFAAMSAGILQVSGRSLLAGLVALFLMILGFALCIPVVVRYLSATGASLAGRLGGIPARLAVGGIATSLSRTGIAIVALAVAVSATVGVSVMVQSFRGAVAEWLDETLRSDLYMGVDNGSLDPDLVESVGRLPGVAEFSSSRRVWLESETGRTRLIVLKMASRSYAGTRLLDADPDSAWAAFEADEAVIVSEPYAYRNGVGPGDPVFLDTAAGRHRFRIAATFRSYDANPGSVLMSRRTYERYWPDRNVDSIGIYLRDGTDAANVVDDIAALAAGRQAVELRSNRALKVLSLEIFDRTFIITDVLYWLAVGVAVVGILGAMLALQLERARELAVLRALGVTPGQLGIMVTLQSGLIGLLSGLAALPLGLLMAWLLIEVINRRAFGWSMSVTIAPGPLVSALALAVGAALVAGLYPAWRAARSRPALAIREE